MTRIIGAPLPVGSVGGGLGVDGVGRARPGRLGDAGGQLDRAPQRGRLVLGLLELLLRDGARRRSRRPVWTCAWPSFRTALRIVIAVSRLPS